MARKVFITSVSLPKDILAEIDTRCRSLRIKSRSDYFVRVILKDIHAGGPLEMPEFDKPRPAAAASKKKKAKSARA